jgi:hypothetical protein
MESVISVHSTCVSRSKSSQRIVCNSKKATKNTGENMITISLEQTWCSPAAGKTGVRLQLCMQPFSRVSCEQHVSVAEAKFHIDR